MPYIYSNHGRSIRWEDEAYELMGGETAADVFVAPLEPSTEQPATLPSTSGSSLEVRLATIEAQLERFLKIATGITATTTSPAVP